MPENESRPTNSWRRGSALAMTIALSSASVAQADVTVGVSVSATGPAAVLGIPEKNTVALCPTTIAGEKVNYLVLDDASDPAQVTKNARKLASESKVDLFIGSSSVPGALALNEVAAETRTPQLSLAPSPATDPSKDAWSFRIPQSNELMAKALVDDMKKSGVKTLGFIGFADSYGEGFLQATKAALAGTGIKLDPIERYNRTDTSAIGQALKILSANPQAVLVVASGAPAALPQTTLIDRGYRGKFYQSHGAVSRQFIELGGKSVDGTVFPIGPIVVAEQLPASNPSRAVGLDYVKKYEAKYGAGSMSPFGGYLYDACLLLQSAASTALKTSKPGTPEFRSELRDALDATKELVGTHGIYTFSAKNHYGLDERGRVLIRPESGKWKLVKAP